MKKIITFVMCLFCINVYAEYTGCVYVDKNGNGSFDTNEKGLGNIAVSDGLNVVLTAVDGSFSLPGHSKERFIFITTPSGYKTNNAYYQHIEQDKNRYDFGLQLYQNRIAKDGSHSFIQIADSEISGFEGNEIWSNNVRDYAFNENVAFVIHTGDICYEKGLKSHIKLMNTANMNTQMFYCIGNHDLVKGKYGEEMFENLYGPVYYSFEMGNMHYIVTPMSDGDYSPSYTKEEVSRWMKNDLAVVPKSKSVIVFNHDLLTHDDKFVFGVGEDEKVNLNQHNLKAWIYGHWHTNYIKKQGEVYSVCTSTPDQGGIDHSTSAFRVIHVSGNNDLRSELRYSYVDKHVNIVSPTTGNVPFLSTGNIPISVNVYSSISTVKKVSYECFVRNKNIVGNRTLKQKTDFNWEADMPIRGLKSGDSVTLRVKAFFDNKEVVETEQSFAYRPDDETKIKLKENWCNMLGDAEHLGISSASLDSTLSLVWTKNVGANLFMSSPLIYEGNVYVASVDENYCGEAFVFALNASDGTLRWKYKVRNSIKNTIAADEGRIYAQDVEGFLYAIDAKAGNLLWEKKLNVNGLPPIVEGVAATNGIVYAGAGKGLCASDGKTGVTIWENSSWRQGEGSTNTIAVNDKILVQGAQWRGLYGHDAKTGELRWELEKEGLRNRGASASLHGNIIYITSQSSIFVIDALSGRIIVRKKLPMSVDATSTPLLTDNLLIFGSAQSGVIALDNETLETQWHVKTGKSLIYTAPYTRTPYATVETSPILAGNTVWFGASDGCMYGVNKNDGHIKWKYDVGAPIFSSMSASGNVLFATDFAGNVYAFLCR